MRNQSRTWVLVLTALASFMVALDALVVATALSTIRLDLGATVEQLEWTVNSYTLSFAVLLLIVPLVVAGFGAAAIPAGQNAVVSGVAPSEIGKASGAFNMLRQLGAAFGVAILAAVFATWGSLGSAEGFSSGFVPAMLVSAALWLPGRSVPKDCSPQRLEDSKGFVRLERRG